MRGMAEPVLSGQRALAIADHGWPVLSGLEDPRGAFCRAFCRAWEHSVEHGPDFVNLVGLVQGLAPEGDEAVSFHDFPEAGVCTIQLWPDPYQ